MLSQTALGCYRDRLFSALTSPGARTGHCRLRDGSTQHVRGKQFIFLPQSLTGGKNKTSLGSSTDELFTEMKKIHNG